jgi:ubiquitin-like 1-activating enzyme E1 B
MNLLTGIKATVGPELMDKIQSCQVLLVGAGGIGCELLKNLALCGFRRVHVIDLDTIDVSNLNRQLLFRSQHVGHPKCTVAAQVATQMASDPSQVEYIAHHGNVCDNSFFHTQFVEQFDLVLNALDNVTARRRVNRICLAASVPLIEAGTTGYLGQVNVIDKESGVACYECKTQETQKVYPICTIR